MPVSDFFEKFPTLADTELRNITILPGSGLRLPPDRYAFIELYRDDKGCDCRRTVIAVLAEKEQRFVAYINIGFDTNDPMAGPFLDPINPQADYAERLLEIFTDLINHDAAYLRRLQRHYVMFKEKVEGRRYKGPPFEKTGSVKRIAEPPEFAEKSTTTTVSMLSATGPSSPLSDPVVQQQPKVGRNAPCPCGSGKKYKKCCMLKPQTDRDEHSEPADTPNNTSTAAVAEEERAQPPAAEQYLDKARSLVADLTAVGSTLVMENILEGKREVWTERLFWMALWAQACLARNPLPWQDLLIPARELQRGTPLSDIPLMHAIATRSVQSAWQRAQGR